MILKALDSDKTEHLLDTDDDVVHIDVSICQSRAQNGKNPYCVHWRTESGGNYYAFFWAVFAAYTFKDNLHFIQANLLT